jgi:hypothetical protein
VSDEVLTSTYHFLRIDYVPTQASGGPCKDLIHVTGPEASGGVNEYSAAVNWDHEVEALLYKRGPDLRSGQDLRRSP